MHLTDAFIQSDLQLHSGYKFFFISMCVPWESNPQTFVLLTQCSTTEPHRNTYTIYYRANLGVGMDVRVWFVCCCKKMVCVLVIYGGEKLHCKSQIQPLWAPVEFCWHLTGEIWYCAQHFFYWKHIFWDILKFGTQLVEIYGIDFIAGLKFNIFHKIYILYKIFITHFHKLELFWFNFLNLFFTSTIICHGSSLKRDQT